ncbi:hypothetical protein [Sporosarcina sp. ITBMC105]
MSKYKCVIPMVLEVVDDDGWRVENEHTAIEEGSIWELDNSDYRFVGDSDSIRLEDETGRWMEIQRDDFVNHFIAM